VIVAPFFTSVSTLILGGCDGFVPRRSSPTTAACFASCAILDPRPLQRVSPRLGVDVFDRPARVCENPIRVFADLTRRDFDRHITERDMNIFVALGIFIGHPGRLADQIDLRPRQSGLTKTRSELVQGDIVLIQPQLGQQRLAPVLA
jgi:hypothetical protein